MKRCSKCKRKVDHVTKRGGFQLCDSCLAGLQVGIANRSLPSFGQVLAEVLSMTTGATQSENDVRRGRR